MKFRSSPAPLPCATQAFRSCSRTPTNLEPQGLGPTSLHQRPLPKQATLPYQPTVIRRDKVPRANLPKQASEGSVPCHNHTALLAGGWARLPSPTMVIRFSVNVSCCHCRTDQLMERTIHVIDRHTGGVCCSLPRRIETPTQASSNVVVLYIAMAVKVQPICLCRQWPRGSTRKRRARERSTEGVGRMTSNAMPTEEKAEGRRGRMDGCVGTALRYPLTQVPAIPTSLSKQAYPQAKHTKG